MLRGFTAQAALDAPRFCISAGTPDHDDKDDEFGVVNSEVYFEDAIPPATIAKLRGESMFGWIANCLLDTAFQKWAMMLGP